MVNFTSQENISKNIILIDGITRCGKSLFSNIIPSLQNVEQLQFFTLLEHVVPALSKNAINKEFAKSSIRTIMNELAYNMLISRNVNFRYKDQTSILNHPDSKKYFERLSKDEGDEIVNDLRLNEKHFPFMTHDMLVNLEFLDLLDIDYKMIHIFRHPVDLIYSWVKRGWGERFLYDPRSFTLSIKYNTFILPWYCDGYEEEWLSLNPTERCAFVIFNLIDKTLIQLKKAKYPNRIYNLTFENFVQDTNLEIAKISDFIGSKQTYSTTNALSNANCPRKINLFDRDKKFKELKNTISDFLCKKLVNYSNSYEDNIYGININ
jgi:hypothetical protein